MKPSLDNAYARVRRAEEHLEDIKRQTSALGSSVISWKEDKQGLALPNTTGLPIVFGILVGETIYNLRAALDYLIYELAFLDSGRIQKGTQFPVVNSKKNWLKRDPAFLKGLSVKHQTLIEGLQPHAGCSWTQPLRDLSNPDKHRTLTLVRTSSLVYKKPESSSRTGVDMPSQFSVQVKFDDGTAVIEALEALHVEVTIVLDSFNPEF